VTWLIPFSCCYRGPKTPSKIASAITTIGAQQATIHHIEWDGAGWASSSDGDPAGAAVSGGATGMAL